MGRKLIDFFQEKFDANLKHTKSRLDAFEKTNEQIGFDAYSSYNSYLTTRKRKKAAK